MESKKTKKIKIIRNKSEKIAAQYRQPHGRSGGLFIRHYGRQLSCTSKCVNWSIYNAFSKVKIIRIKNIKIPTPNGSFTTRVAK